MAIDLRSLYATIGLGRPDVDQAMLGFCIQRAMRDVCRKTLLARQTFEYAFTANTNSVGLTLTNASPLSVTAALWKGASETDFRALNPIPYLEAEEGGYWKQTGRVESFSQQGPTVLIYRTPIETGTLRLSVAYVPTTDLDSAPLPDYALDAVELRAEALLWKVGGPGMNLQMALQKDHEYRRCIGALRSISFFGEVGQVMMVAPQFP